MQFKILKILVHLYYFIFKKWYQLNKEKIKIKYKYILIYNIKKKKIEK